MKDNKQKSFTMIELLVVMGVLAVLISLIYTVTTTIPENARDNQAKSEVRMIVMAIKAYRTDYGKWPNQTQSDIDKTYFTNNYLIIQPLMGSNLMGANPRNKIYFEGQTNRLDSKGNYLDPWGMPYVITIDENEDNILTVTQLVNQVFNRRVSKAENEWKVETNSISYYAGAPYNNSNRYFVIPGIVVDVGSFKNTHNSISIVSWKN